MSSWMPSTKKASSCTSLRFSNGSTAIEGRASVAAEVGAGFTAAAVVVVGTLRCAYSHRRPPPRKSSRRQYRKLGARDSLLTAVAVVPGQRHDDRQAERQAQHGKLLG